VTTVSGIAVCVGALLTFLFPCFTSNKTERCLSGALAFAAGIMIFVSLTTVFQHSIAHLEMIMEPAPAFGLAVGYFFAGSLVTLALHHLSHVLSRHHLRKKSTSPKKNKQKNEGRKGGGEEKMKEELMEKEDDDEDTFSVSSDDDGFATRFADSPLSGSGWITAVALAIHNVPQGMALFISSSSRSSLGASLAFSLGLHNIAAGLCIGLPVYFNTGSKLKALGWSALAGIAVPIGGVLAFLCLRPTLISSNSLTFGIAYGVVSGMMTCISLRDFLPTAIKLEKKSQGTTFAGVFLGMFIIACSLILTKSTKM